LVWSVQLVAWQVWPVASQKPVTQSPPTKHFLFVAHLLQVGPPQSVSVSMPFCTMSLHAGAEQVFDTEQTPLAQSPPTRHSTHKDVPLLHFGVGEAHCALVEQPQWVEAMQMVLLV